MKFPVDFMVIFSHFLFTPFKYDGDSENVGSSMNRKFRTGTMVRSMAN